MEWLHRATCWPKSVFPMLWKMKCFIIVTVLAGTCRMLKHFYVNATESWKRGQRATGCLPLFWMVKFSRYVFINQNIIHIKQFVPDKKF